MVDYLPLLELRKIEGKDMLEEIEQSGGPEEEEEKSWPSSVNVEVREGVKRDDGSLTPVWGERKI